MNPPKEVLVDRAVDIWKFLLANPTYDNGGRGLAAALTPYLASQMPSNATAERLEEFGRALRRVLLTPNERGYHNTRMGVDYHPGEVLGEAADEVGLEMEWPYKTDVFLTEDAVAVSAGYRAERVYHYPLYDPKRWLVTTLRGSDISEVIKYIEGGKPDFHVDYEEDVEGQQA